MDPLNDFLKGRPPTAARPLLGITVLLVEDSRYASDAFRIMCLRSGARIRRADTLASARKHLRTYQPTVAIIDIGLPDEPGTVLIEELSRGSPRIEVLLATTGDPENAASAMRAGADGVIVKPIEQLAQFHNSILQHMPRDRQPSGPSIVADDRITPDPIALRNDLEHVSDLLHQPDSVEIIDYILHFLSGVARSSRDTELLDAASSTYVPDTPGDFDTATIAKLAALIDARLTATPPI